MRVDKFLWCVRLCKSRSLAAEECDRGHVRIGERMVKASAAVRTGDLVALRQPPVWRVVEVKAIPLSRVGAKLVSEFMEDRTPAGDLEKLEAASKVQAQFRPSGEGRPTKKERRDIDRFTDAE